MSRATKGTMSPMAFAAQQVVAIAAEANGYIMRNIKSSLDTTGEGSVVAFSLELHEVNKDGDSVREVYEFKKFAPVYGLEERDLHAKFQHLGVNYEIIGHNAKIKQAPILIRDQSSGDIIAASPQLIKACLRKE